MIDWEDFVKRLSELQKSPRSRLERMPQVLLLPSAEDTTFSQENPLG